MKDQGGLEAIEKTNQEKGKLLYDTIDANHGFYRGTVETESRSLMNATFRLPSEDLEAKFLINRKVPGTRTGGEIRQALKVFETGIFETELCQRVAYVDAMKYGVSVMQFAPGSKAAQEVEQLCGEITKGLEKPEIGDAADIRPISSLYQEEPDNMTYHDSQTL